MDNEFILMDRIQKIKQIVNKYGEDNFYISFSGGKDSNVLNKLIDMALPDNRIPRVYCNTGIEYKAIVDFVKAKAAADDRFIIIQPKVPIKRMLEEKGYPFKSKLHSCYVDIFRRRGKNSLSVKKYLKQDETVEKYFSENCCPKSLEYQFSENDGLDFKISDKCCHELKVNPLTEYQKSHNKSIKIIGIMADEGGRRAMTSKLFNNNIGCMTFRNNSPDTFKPLFPITKDWKEWFVDAYSVELPVLYYPPYNFERTGCKGCPFAQDLQHELDILKTMFPAEYKQCEYIWKPVYDEYRRLGYRLRKVDENQISFFD